MGNIGASDEIRNLEQGRSHLSWGGDLALLLPASLRTKWADDVLPEWVSRELGLQAGATIRALNSAAIPTRGVSGRIEGYFTLLLSSRIESVRPLLAVERSWPTSLSFDQVPWRRRTRNRLMNWGLPERLSELPRITFNDLFDIPGMGAVSVLDFTCTLEAALDAWAKQQEALFVEDGPSRVSAVLLEVLTEPWADMISERDPRFVDLMPSGRGSLTERIDQLTSDPEASAKDLEILASAIILIRARLDELAKKSLEECLSDYVSELSGIRDGRLDAIVARFQLNGSGSTKTQEEAGELAGGITRQRVQQLESRASRRRPPHPVVMPALDRAISALMRAVPIDAQDGAHLLRREGITRVLFDPRSVIAAAKFTGRPTLFEVRRVYDRRVVAAVDPALEMVDRVVEIARRQAGQAGASSIAQVADRIVGGGVELSEERVGELLRHYSGAQFLGTDWFCFPLSPNDSIRNLSRKMLSVTTPLDVSSLRDGIKRAFRFRRSSGRRGATLPAVPPRDVLAGYYRAHPDFAIAEDGMVRSVAPLDYRIELGAIEQVMVTVLRHSPSRVLDRPSFADACEERGTNLNSLWTLATYSPVIDHLGVGLWTLRGTAVDPATLEAYRKSNALRPRERRVVDYGWAPTGELWVAARLPAHVESFIFGIPSDIGRFLGTREFPATDSDGVECGVIRVYESLQAGGSARFLRRAGADEGDILFVSFDLTRGTSTLSLIDDDSLEELSPEI